jgi:hypothetical protein
MPVAPPIGRKMRANTTCPNPIKRMGFYSASEGRLRPMPCGSWSCSTCGPAKAYRLGLKAANAFPERFVTLTAAGSTPSEAYEGLKRLSKALRRRGYTWEYLAVPEPHKNGSWHLHVLQKGSFIPQRELSMLAERAGMGRIVHIRAIRGAQSVAKYLVKYMVKDEAYRPPGSRRYKSSARFWGEGGFKGFEQLHKERVKASDWKPRYLPSGGFITEDGLVLELPKGGEQIGEETRKNG